MSADDTEKTNAIINWDTYNLDRYRKILVSVVTWYFTSSMIKSTHDTDLKVSAKGEIAKNWWMAVFLQNIIALNQKVWNYHWPKSTETFRYTCYDKGRLFVNEHHLFQMVNSGMPQIYFQTSEDIRCNMHFTIQLSDKGSVYISCSYFSCLTWRILARGEVYCDMLPANFNFLIGIKSFVT